jgi:hypothetical protein
MRGPETTRTAIPMAMHARDRIRIRVAAIEHLVGR